ncbi:MAG TPA: DNA gyrase inhibitor YacG [Pyrinomonadaceae bacterium]
MKCPTCGEPVKWQDNPYRPFCSERCKLIDFGRWANGEYRVPGPETPLPDAESAEHPLNETPPLEEE